MNDPIAIFDGASVKQIAGWHWRVRAEHTWVDVAVLAGRNVVITGDLCDVIVRRGSIEGGPGGVVRWLASCTPGWHLADKVRAGPTVEWSEERARSDLAEYADSLDDDSAEGRRIMEWLSQPLDLFSREWFMTQLSDEGIIDEIYDAQSFGARPSIELAWVVSAARAVARYIEAEQCAGEITSRGQPC